MLDAFTNPWSSEGTRIPPRPLSPKSPPESSSPSPSRVPKLVFTTGICDITPPVTTSSSPVHRPTDLPGYLRIPIPSPSRGRPTNARFVQTPSYTIERGLADHTPVSPGNTLRQKTNMLSSYSSPTATLFCGHSNHYTLGDSDDEDENEDDTPLGYPYETCADILMFAREYLCGMLDLIMTWLEGRPGIRAST